MKCKLDEKLPEELAEELRSGGHDVQTVADEGLIGSDDRKLLEHAQAEERVFVTMDKGIADVRLYPPEQFSGIVLMRPKATGRSATFVFARRHLPEVLAQNLKGRLVIISEAGIRTR